MIRFVLIGDQIEDDSNHFAFFDTVIGKLLSFRGEQVFDSPHDFWCSTPGLENQRRCYDLIPGKMKTDDAAMLQEGRKFL